MDEKYQIIVRQNNKNITIGCCAQETILEAMIRHGISCRVDCGGRGTCGKCKIRAAAGKLPVTDRDQAVLTEEELHAGYRLACRAIPEENVTVLPEDTKEADISVVIENHAKLPAAGSISLSLEGYVIGIDLGTTTLAVRLTDSAGGNILATYTAVNPQRAYGADVISRMKASGDGKKEQLKDMIRDALKKGILEVIKGAGINAGMVKKIAVAGNTVMMHLLMGYSCESLGVYPFIPVNTNTIRLKFRELFSPVPDQSGGKASHPKPDAQIFRRLEEVPVILLPGISAFVGGDIAAGLALCGYDTAEQVSMLIDLGTNGEIALGNRDKILVTSAAAGPAFEGGNISCGTGGIPGAISHISLQENGILFETIGGRPPVGICGTGVIELVSELYRTGIVDNTGLLAGKFFEAGYPVVQRDRALIRFTQKDIRELQLAKAAVRAGIELLMKRYGIDSSRIDKVHLAGGFGFFLDSDKAIRIGLLPEKFRDKIFAVGNSSLAGAIQYAARPGFADGVDAVLAKSEELYLSNDPDFNEMYLNHMSF